MPCNDRNLPSRRWTTGVSAALILIAALSGGCNRDLDSAPTSVEGETATDAPTPSEPESRSSAELLVAAEEARRRGATDQAWKRVQQVLLAQPDSAAALASAAQIQRDRGNFAEAAELAWQTAEVDAKQLAAMMVVAFECHLRAGDLDAAEQDLKRAIENDPDATAPHRYLAQLLNAEGRRVEASRHVRELIRLRVIEPNELLSLIDLRGPFLLASFDQLIDETKLSRLTLGKLRFEYSTTRGKPDQYLQQLERLTEAFPDCTATAAFRCRVLADNDRMDELKSVLETLPAGIDEQPEYWFAVGTLLAAETRHREAIRAFSEALARDPTDRESLRSIIASTIAMGQPEQSAKLRERLAELDQIFRIARDADREQAMWISKTLQSHVRLWESTAWLMQAARISGQAERMIPELNQRLTAIEQWHRDLTDKQQVDLRLNRLLGFDRGDYPSPNLQRLPSGTADKPDPMDSPTPSTIRFVDVAAACGIDASYQSGLSFENNEFALFQVNGGGLAILDYDLDGRVDIYMMQSGGDPRQPDSSDANLLFRQLRGGQTPDKPSAVNRFADVSALAGSDDRRFGQGVCAGDVNQDGLPDLILANIGTNGILINQGDGTFAAADDRLGDNPFSWTSSLGLADLDGDHLPEWVEVNYLDDDRVFTRFCRDNYADCQPHVFEPCPDRVRRMDARGQFKPWSLGSPGGPPPRFGFGLVIANFDGQAGNDIFVSNDGDFNHFWVSTDAEEQPGRYRLVESAGVRGCSIGRRGQSQACMGIGHGDFDRNGMLDLHVTNFRNESVNLFLQSESGVFVDQASPLGLAKPSFGVLGFGTQAADLDHDGWLDLTVLNGHLYDARFEGTPYQMEPQVFRGGPDGFVTADPAALGAYFQKPALGRTLALLDWNRDGGMDFVAGHLDRPLALLQNESSRQNWLQLELVGVTSERDAIGATVRVDSGDNRWTAWQVGGDGLMSSNEPVIHFGIGDAETISSVQIRWPSGLVQTIDGLQTNQRYLIIEGIREPHARQ